MAERPIPAVILGGWENAVSVARTLWRAGVPVDVLADQLTDCPVRHSRARRRYVPRGRRETLAAHWLGWLDGASAPAVLLPCSDEALEFIARHRGPLEAVGHRPIESDDSAVLAVLDKQASYAIARAAGIPAPLTAMVSTPDELAASELPFPCGVKPVHSHRFRRLYPVEQKGGVLMDAEHARRVLEPILAQDCPMLLTEVIAGPDDSYRSYFTFIDGDGEPLLHFTKRKLRQYPPHFGLGTYHLTEWNAEVADLGLRFARAAGLRGIVNVEFKRDIRDGQLKLVECNPRFTQANEQLRVAGVDLARLAYNRLAGLPSPAVSSFTEHLAMWLPFNDLRALRAYRRSGELSIGAWAATLAHRQVLPLFAFDDPRPSFWWWRARTTALASDAARRLTRARRPLPVTNPYA